jgi:hypothetical protein
MKSEKHSEHSLKIFYWSHFGVQKSEYWIKFHLLIFASFLIGTNLQAGISFETKVEEPTIRQDVQTILSDYTGIHFTRPHIPVLRYSADGRIGITGFDFTLIKPEALDQSHSFSNQDPKSNVFKAFVSGGNPVWTHHIAKDTV